tara:strand:- start:753 stop:2036 length:1284 start_codon:yes stop_codon:yes gene_type:complete
MGGGPLREIHSDGTVSIELDRHSGDEAGSVVHTPRNAKLFVVTTESVDQEAQLAQLKALVDEHVPRATKVRVAALPDSMSLTIDGVKYSFDIRDQRSAYTALCAYIKSVRKFPHEESTERDEDGTLILTSVMDALPEDPCPGFVRFERKTGTHTWQVFQGMMQSDGQVQRLGRAGAEPVPAGYERKKNLDRNWLANVCLTHGVPATARYDGPEAARRCLVHDNGGRPFCVRAYNVPLRSQEEAYAGATAARPDATMRVAAFRVPFRSTVPEKDESDDAAAAPYYSQRLWASRALAFFDGGNGSSVLVHLKPLSGIMKLLANLFHQDVASHIESFLYSYTFVGHCIYQFVAPERIEAFVSHIGSNDVPYPVAISATRVYYMLYRRHGPRDLQKPLSYYTSGAAYDAFYDNEAATQPMDHTRMIYGRID